MLIPFTHYLNSKDCVSIRSGQCMMYQNVNHPANSHKKPVTFKKYANTGVFVYEFPGVIYTGNLWIEIDESSGIHIDNLMIDRLVP